MIARFFLLVWLLSLAAQGEGTVRIGSIDWYTDYDQALNLARSQGKPIWLFFGENLGSPGSRHFASGPLRDKRVVSAARGFIPVFIDTLKDHATTHRFGENMGSYPVLRVQNLDGRDLANRLDGNLCAGRLSVDAVVAQLEHGSSVFRLAPGESPTPRT